MRPIKKGKPDSLRTFCAWFLYNGPRPVTFILAKFCRFVVLLTVKSSSASEAGLVKTQDWLCYNRQVLQPSLEIWRFYYAPTYQYTSKVPQVKEPINNSNMRSSNLWWPNFPWNQLWSQVPLIKRPLYIIKYFISNS